MTDFATLKKEIDLLVLAQQDTKLEKVAKTGGGEWAGPCPFCGGEDRFRVQPNHHDGPRWFCRGCGDNLWHDAIDYMQRKGDPNFNLAGLTVKKKPSPEPGAPPLVQDAALWREQAAALVQECEASLWTKQALAARQYLHDRGLNEHTLKAWRIGYNHEPRYIPLSRWGMTSQRSSAFEVRPGIVIPCWHDDLYYIKIRQPDGVKPKYLHVKGSRPWLFGAETFFNRFDAFIFEGEFDCMLAHQESVGLGVAFGSFPANQVIAPSWLRYLAKIERFIVCHDMDAAGQQSASKLKARLGSKVKIATLPQGNDLTDFYLADGNVFEWLYQALEAAHEE